MGKTSSDRDFEAWLNYFDCDKPSLTKFIKLLKNKDGYFLTHPLEVDFDNELYSKIRPGGFIEKDFQEILGSINPKEVYYKTRLAIFLTKGFDLTLIKNRIGEDNFFAVIEKSLIDGHYEEFGIAFEKLISVAVSKYNLPRNLLVDISFMRGVNLGSRYPTEKEEKALKSRVFKNKIKCFFGK